MEKGYVLYDVYTGEVELYRFLSEISDKYNKGQQIRTSQINNGSIYKRSYHIFSLEMWNNRLDDCYELIVEL